MVHLFQCVCFRMETTCLMGLLIIRHLKGKLGKCNLTDKQRGNKLEQWTITEGLNMWLCLSLCSERLLGPHVSTCLNCGIKVAKIKHFVDRLSTLPQCCTYATHKMAQQHAFLIVSHLLAMKLQHYAAHVLHWLTQTH